jgi:3-methyladenine DNA glycosylase AlkC
MEKREERKAFKDWFDRTAAEALAARVAAVWPSFESARFVRLATEGLAQREMMARVQAFSDALHACLPPPPRSLEILTSFLPPPLEGDEPVTGGWLLWPVGQYIADHGLDHFEASMEAMIALTQRFTAEFAVRPFAERFPREVVARFQELTTHPSAHVRRWCSEGLRPRLPWGRRLRHLMEDPGPVWPILEALRDDPSPYVRTSVANHLNDLAKDHPEAVLACAEKWMQSAPPERIALLRRGLRSLVKNGRPEALAILGFTPPRGLTVAFSLAPTRIARGESVVLEARLHNGSRRPQRLMLDYAVHFVRRGARSAAKVFKGGHLQIAPGETLVFTRRHPMRATTVRALYPGLHRVELQVNGQRLAEAAFEFLG